MGEIVVDIDKSMESFPEADLSKTLKSILNLYTSIQPSSTFASYYFAKLQFKSENGDLTAAQSSCTQCLSLDPTFTPAHLISAQISLLHSNFKNALSSLELAVSYDFKVRSIPVFWITKARALKGLGNYNESLDALKICLALPGIKSESTPLSDRFSIFNQLIDVHSKLKQYVTIFLI